MSIKEFPWPLPNNGAIHTQLTLSSVSHLALYANAAIVAAMRMYAAYLSVARMSMPRPLGYGQALKFVPFFVGYGVSFKGAPSGVVRDGVVAAFAHDGCPLGGYESVRDGVGDDYYGDDQGGTREATQGQVRGAVVACAV